MKLHRLDAGPSTMVVDCRNHRFQICYLGSLLPPGLDLTEIPLLTSACTPHGELDGELFQDGFPTQYGQSQTQAALLARRNNRALLIELKVTRCHSDAGILELHLEDTQARVSVELSFEGLANGVFSSRCTVTNNATDTPLQIDWLASIHLPLPSTHNEVERYGGFWANELLCERVPLTGFSLDISSRRGRSSHQSFPSLISGEKGFSQQRKQALLVTLEWSGNHRLRIERAPAGGHCLQAGVELQAGELCVPPGEQCSGPAALFALSDQGINGLRSQFQNYWYARKNLKPTMQRPIHFNSWEANYFVHDAVSSCLLMDEAKALGAERFVLDDGWMEGRVGIGVGLGDWTPCRSRYPDGLKPLAAHARKLGMSFGLWVEPEMATLDSQVTQEHKDWLVNIPGRALVSGRRQYLLNICLPEVRNHILSCLERLIKDCEPDYLKWDMNRDHAQVGFGSAATPVAMTQAWYELLQELNTRHPGITIESCAAGGARTDAGALARSQRLWPSDSMDPLQRFDVMKHASTVLPPTLLGSHVGASPSSTSGASLPLSTRCVVALLGHMGLELSPRELTKEERSTVQRWTRFFKAERDSLAGAEFHYLDTQEPGIESLLLWDADKTRGLLFILRQSYPITAQPPILKLPACLSGRYFDVELLNPEDADFVQQDIDWHRGGAWSAAGDTLHLAGLRAPFLRYGHCALIQLRPRPNLA
ncbi:alpha-galactosidase [Congregibacter variabilis]|uniref:alpha-galactosidase n=1 Tax=Congregibacter variabilis TaxID=3081200 RepID=A0ABZ0I7U8_9GAMM|nr:alpha-galactosidase [Congregibacter sp. IMCC43200]